MKTKVLLCLGIVMGIFYAGGQTAAQSEVALATRANKLQALAEKLKKRDKQDRQQVQEWTHRTGIPIRRELPNGKILELQRFAPGAGPVFYVTNNVDAADTVSTDELWPGGSAGLSLDGSGMTVGEWDGGAVLADHPDLYGRVTQVDGTTAISDHATHVAGTLIGAGVALLPQARGMAYAAHLDAVSLSTPASSPLKLSSTLGLSSGTRSVDEASSESAESSDDTTRLPQSEPAEPTTASGLGYTVEEVSCTLSMHEHSSCPIPIPNSNIPLHCSLLRCASSRL